MKVSGKVILLPFCFSLLAVVVILVLPRLLLKPSFCHLTVNNKCSEGLSSVELILGKQTITIENLQNGQSKSVHIKIGPENSLAVIARFPSGRILKAENLLWIDSTFSTSAQVDIAVNKISVRITEEKFFLKSQW